MYKKLDLKREGSNLPSGVTIRTNPSCFFNSSITDLYCPDFSFLSTGIAPNFLNIISWSQPRGQGTPCLSISYGFKKGTGKRLMVHFADK